MLRSDRLPNPALAPYEFTSKESPITVAGIHSSSRTEIYTGHTSERTNLGKCPPITIHQNLLP